ncbi:MAG: adenylate/guanylate cyclase domain-containing protein [Spirochaetales bacterium]|nr:adenylate/guanylate cyclase domain-containing protein [Spirochaetales bacterium]
MNDATVDSEAIETEKAHLDDIDINEFISEDELVSPGLALVDQASSDLFITSTEETDELSPYLSDHKLVSTEGDLQTRIANYYLNKQLQQALLLHGDIPSIPEERTIGIGFVDIVDYSYIASWLSPKENQVFLNGLYTAFHTVLKKRGGYLNKISGDSVMFHFGGNIDPSTKDMERKEAEAYIARELLQTCVEIQHTCRLFNNADAEFLNTSPDGPDRKAIQMAFMIISNLRENLAMVSGINAMFQVRVRIGACLGEVCIGNFGPEDARQWDVIGEPVIVARRMESTAPIDGLRISASLYKVLEKNGLAEAYYRQFVNEAKNNGSCFQRITREELFKPKTVILQDKNNVDFDSYSVQTNPILPEFIREQVAMLLEKQEDGAESIVDILKYHRGNRHILYAIETLFRESAINIRKTSLLIKLYPAKYRMLLEKMKGNQQALDRYVENKISLHSLFSLIDKYQDTTRLDASAITASDDFSSHNEYIRKMELELQMNYQNRQKARERYNYINEVLFPLFLAHLKAAILEHQKNGGGHAGQ